jgi:hypothetical protein
MAATSIEAFSCGNGASAYITVQAAGVIIVTITCKRLPGVFEAGKLPENQNDPAQIYLAQLRTHAKCGQATGCTVLCKVSVTDDPANGLNTLDGEQKTYCEAVGGTYQIRLCKEALPSLLSCSWTLRYVIQFPDA